MRSRTYDLVRQAAPDLRLKLWNTPPIPWGSTGGSTPKGTGSANRLLKRLCHVVDPGRNRLAMECCRGKRHLDRVAPVDCCLDLRVGQDVFVGGILAREEH